MKIGRDIEQYPRRRKGSEQESTIYKEAGYLRKSGHVLGGVVAGEHVWNSRTTGDAGHS